MHGKGHRRPIPVRHIRIASEGYEQPQVVVSRVASSQQNLIVRHHPNEVGLWEVRLVHGSGLSWQSLMTAFQPLRKARTPGIGVAMWYEKLLGSIEGLLAVGAIIGLLVGGALANPKFGCSTLLVVPIAMFAYVSWWQGQHPELLRSTSGVDFVFGPFWPSLGAVAGFLVGRRIRSIFVL